MAYELMASLRLDTRAFHNGVRSAIGSIRQMQETMRGLRNGTRGCDEDLSRFGQSQRDMGDSMRNFTSFTGGTIAKLGILAGAVGTATFAFKGMSDAMAEAARNEQSEVVIKAMIDDKDASKQYLGMVRKLAKDSPILDMSEMMANSKSFITQTKDVDQLKQMWKLAEKMVAVDPAQGIEGAALALRELFSGDAQSIVERFEMPRKVMNDIKGMKLSDQLTELDKVFNKMNMTDKLVNDMSSTALSKWNKLKETLKMGLSDMGTGMIKSAKPIIDQIQSVIDSGTFKNMTKNIGAGLGSAFSALAKGFKFIGDNWGAVRPVIDGIKNGFNLISQAIGSFVNKYVLPYLPVFIKQAQTVYGIVSPIFGSIKSTILDVAGAVGTFVNKFVIPLIPVFMDVMKTVWGVVNPILKLAVIGFENIMSVVRFLVKQVVEPLIPVIAQNIKTMWSHTKPILTKLADVFDSIVSVIQKASKHFRDFMDTAADFNPKNFEIGMPKWAGGDGLVHKKSHYHGLSNVPRDGYAANLHKGERILTAKENRQYTRGGRVGGMYIDMRGAVIREEADLDKLADKFAAKIFQSWDGGA